MIKLVILFRLITGSLNCVILSSPLTVKKKKKTYKRKARLSKLTYIKINFLITAWFYHYFPKC